MSKISGNVNHGLDTLQDKEITALRIELTFTHEMSGQKHLSSIWFRYSLIKFQTATFDFSFIHLQGANCLLQVPWGDGGDVITRQRTARDKESYGEDQGTLGHSARLQILLFLADKAELAF